MEQPKYTSCLRPLNTEILVKQLYEGKSINLVGHPDAGRARMLDDIERCATATKHIRLNMKAYRNSYEALLKSIATQMGIAYHEDTSMADLTGIISRQSVKVFMLIDNFDAVLDNPELDSKYTRSFFDTLNSLKTNPIFRSCVRRRSRMKIHLFTSVVEILVHRGWNCKGKDCGIWILKM